jgi:nucleotidyltransferase/DNA polymerase involved in DNA repair
MSNRSMGAAQASALRISQLESEVERLKGLEATVAALSKRLDKFEREAAEVSALENYPDATPTAENATDYDQHRDKCCTNIDHWKLMVRGSQRYKMENYVNVIHEKFKYETDFRERLLVEAKPAEEARIQASVQHQDHLPTHRNSQPSDGHERIQARSHHELPLRCTRGRSRLW